MDPGAAAAAVLTGGWFLVSSLPRGDERRMAAALVGVNPVTCSVARGDPGGTRGSMVLAVAYAADGSLLSGGFEGVLRVRCPEGSEWVGQGHRGVVGSVAACGPDRLVSAGWDGGIILWSLATRAPLAQRPAPGGDSPMARVAGTPDGRLVAVGSSSGVVELLDGTTLNTVRTLSGATAQIVSLCFSPDGARVAGGGYDGTVRVWDVATGDLRATLGSSGGGGN